MTAIYANTTTRHDHPARRRPAMKITYVANAIIPSRMANSIHVVKMCDAYAALGHDVELLVPQWKNAEPVSAGLFAFYDVQNKFAVRHASVTPAWNRYELPYYALWMSAQALRGRPDLIHTRSLPVAWGLTTLRRSPALYEMHQPSFVAGAQMRMYRQTVRSPRLRGLVVITRALQSLLPEEPALAPVIVAPDAVDARALDCMLDKSTARAQLGLADTGRPICLYSGHLYAGKGLDLIIDLATHAPESDFLIVGGKPDHIERYRKRTRDIANIHFAGFVSPAQVRTYLHAADVLLLPYADRTATAGGTDNSRVISPMKMFEYMAAGRPILASTLPVLQEVLRHGENALLLPYDEPQAWVDALRTLHADPALARIPRPRRPATTCRNTPGNAAPNASSTRSPAHDRLDLPSFGAFVMTYNRPHILSDTLRTILEQTRPPEHILVVDNGDAAQTAALVPGAATA